VSHAGAGPHREGAARADLRKAPSDVAAMFDRVAQGYDRTNALLSLGSQRRWRREVVAALDLRPGERVLDLAAGTGSSTEPLVAGGHEAVGCDFSLGMLRAGRRARSHVPLVGADATRLPFRDGSFDAVTTSFGLRNVSDPGLALAEMLRVTRPSGRLVVCEFSRPTWRPFRRLYEGYLGRVLPAVARRASSNPVAYEYLAESIQAWPDQAGLAELIEGAGWVQVEWKDLTGGIVALHRAARPGGARRGGHRGRPVG
jgi:demethylmenaquinone methyltransferase/2-methoxy-6-polyprenyl-1,4-benzoquinol methylase